MQRLSIVMKRMANLSSLKFSTAVLKLLGKEEETITAFNVQITHLLLTLQSDTITMQAPPPQKKVHTEILNMSSWNHDVICRAWRDLSVDSFWIEQQNIDWPHSLLFSVSGLFIMISVFYSEQLSVMRRLWQVWQRVQWDRLSWLAPSSLWPVLPIQIPWQL